jgi:hypothetical protein
LYEPTPACSVLAAGPNRGGIEGLPTMKIASNNAAEPDLDLTARALLVLGTDINNALEMVQRIQIQVRALSRRHPL